MEETEHKWFSNFILKIIKSFGPTEKLIFYLFTVLLCLSTLSMVSNINEMFLVEIPAKGGILKEGVLGSPRFINPVLAISETDKTISNLVYSGLLKSKSDGSYTTDLAESYSVSDDGLSYYVRIREGAKFHDKEPVTADDVIFTIEKTLDPVVKSPKRSSWEGVAVEKVNESEIVFNLKKPYSPFLENLTMGILPKHIWQEVSPEEFAFSKWNLEPIGAGPYKIESVEKDGDGIVAELGLESFNSYFPKEFKISEIKFVFFQNFEALVEGYKGASIDSTALIEPSQKIDLDPTNMEGASEIEVTMPRIFGTFFNQNKAPVFSNIEVRKALDQALDKQAIVEEVLGGYGVPLSGPTPRDSWINKNTEEAIELLTKNGWKEGSDGIMEKKTKTNSYKLKFTISTSEVEDLKKTAEILAREWRKLGADVTVNIFEASDLSVNVIKPRNYEMLLFGEVVGREMDLYPFWHSSERNDPGLNIGLYANITVDKLLEEERAAKNEKQKKEKIDQISVEIEKDVPAIFLYSPEYLYIVSSKIRNISGPSIGNPGERFMNIEEWYIETNKIWSIFAQFMK